MPREKDENHPDQKDATRGRIEALMKDMDIAMFATHSDDGTIASRPMSNNREVEYSGTSWYFTLEDKRVARDIAANSQVTLNFQADSQWLSVQGEAVLIDDRVAFEEHYVSDLDQWFEDGIDCPGLVLIEVRAVRATAWGAVSGEVIYA